MNISFFWYQDWVKVAQHDLKHAEVQSKTQGVQSFGAKSGASAANPHAGGGFRAKKLCAQGARASGPPAQQFKNRFERPD